MLNIDNLVVDDDTGYFHMWLAKKLVCSAYRSVFEERGKPRCLKQIRWWNTKIHKANTVVKNTFERTKVYEYDKMKAVLWHQSNTSSNSNEPKCYIEEVFSYTNFSAKQMFIKENNSFIISKYQQHSSHITQLPSILVLYFFSNASMPNCST